MNARTPARDGSCRVTIRTDGTVVVTDNWARLGLAGPPPADRPHLATVPRASAAAPVGVLDYGLLHGEEPAVSGVTGTGAIYVHGCPLRCVTCYQPEFFDAPAREFAGVGALADLALHFERHGAHSVSIVIATRAAAVEDALRLARARGLRIPIVYKYAGTLGPDALDRLRNVVDLFVPDVKALSAGLLARHGLPPGYARAARAGIEHLMRSGARVIVRHLIVPSFAGAVDEVEAMMEALPFAATGTPLSLLTNFYDPSTCLIEPAAGATLDAIEARAERAGVTLLIQGRGDYVPHLA